MAKITVFAHPILKPLFIFASVMLWPALAFAEAGQIVLSDAADARVANWTEVLAGLTAVLAFVSLVQIFFLWRTDKTARLSADAATKAANAATAQNDLAGMQAEIFKKQHEIGRLQFLATHRPRLKVRNVSSSLSIKPTNLSLLPGAAVTGFLTLVNSGGIKATVISSGYRFFFTKSGLPASPPHEQLPRPLLDVGAVLDAGDAMKIFLADTADLDPSRGANQFWTEGWDMYLI